MKKLIFILGIILSVGICCAGETLTVSQEETIDKDLQQLLNIAENNDVWVWERTRAIEKIVKKGDTAAIPTLVRLSENKTSLVRTKVVEALGILGDTRAIPVLRALQEDGAYLIREAATRALIKLGIKLEKLEKPPEVKQEAKLELEETPETKPKAESVVEKERKIETDPIKAINNTLLFQIERRDPATACFLSMFTIGGGQIYNYQPHKAIITYIISVASITAMYFGGQPGITIGGLILFGTWLYGPIDAYNSAVDINKQLEYKYKIGVKFRY